jgi:hypothetical protein
MENDLSGELDLLTGMEPIPPAPPVAVILAFTVVTRIVTTGLRPGTSGPSAKELAACGQG